MSLLGKDLIPSVHICMVPKPGTSVIDQYQISRVCGTNMSDKYYSYHMPPLPGSFLLLWA